MIMIMIMIIIIISWKLFLFFSGMFRDFPECSGMFRNVPRSGYINARRPRLSRCKKYELP